ncbi:unnamed protein product [Caenorhabditis nigoni]
MKAVYSTVFIFLFATTVSTGIRVKRGLSTDEQKKLVDTSNADRQAVGENMGIAFEKLIYSKGLELKAENFRCDLPDERFEVVPLKMNQDMKETVKSPTIGMYLFSREFFNPNNTKIGCSKEKTCSITFEDGPMAGKTAKFWGACRFGPKSHYDFDDSNTPEDAGMPSYEKYVDLLGI